MYLQPKSVFHSVGQGLFYSLKLDNFNMVYDCGSKSIKHLEIAIDKYKSYLTGGIDVLMISHFHDDHVIGLERLLKGTNVKKLIIPYLYPLERLYLSTQHRSARSWYHSFLADPLGTLRELTDIQRVFIIGQPPEDDDINDNDLHPNIDHPDIQHNDELESLPNDEELQTNVSQDMGYNSTGIIIQYKRYFGGWTFRRRWEFQLYNLPISKTIKFGFLRCLLKNGINPRDQAQVLNAIKNKQTRNAIASCYPPNSVKRNNTSLMLYHGPVNHKAIFRAGSLKHNAFLKPRSWKYLLLDCWGLLLTGDVSLNSGPVTNKNVDKVILYFSNKSNNILFCLLPHHGANQSWNDKMLSGFSACIYWIASANSTNSFHPGRQVLLVLLRNGLIPLLCHENRKIIFNSIIYY